MDDPSVINLSVLNIEHEGFAGNVAHATAWQYLGAHADAVLVDVRTQAEWAFVGVPDLSDIAATLVCAEWQCFPDMGVNAQFVAQVEEAVSTKSAAIFTLCRSGMRSQAAAQALTQVGFADCYNVAGGFEGDTDSGGHRGQVNGWKFEGLPWVQN